MVELSREFAKEQTLEFKDIRTAFISVFSTPVREKITKEEAINFLGKVGIKADWPNETKKMFDTFENFGTQRIANQYFRLKLDDINLSIMRQNKNISVTFKLVANVFLTIYPMIGNSTILINVRMEECNVDDAIFLQQSIYGRTKLNATLPAYLDSFRGLISLKDITEKYIETISLALGLPAKNQVIFHSRCVEICDVPKFESFNPEDLLEKFPKQIYGLLVADEGWRFVPVEIARDRLSNRWRTRNFLEVVVFVESIVSINLENCETHKKYRTSQTKIREEYGHEVEDYFNRLTHIAGLNHGPLLMLENASVQLSVINRISEQVNEARSKSIKEILKLRKKLIDTLLKLSCIKIPEIDLLGQNVQRAMNVPNGIEDVKKKLAEIENELIIKYNQRTNQLIILLTLVSLGVGVIDILFQSGVLSRFLI
jgi:hypothetical protein